MVLCISILELLLVQLPLLFAEEDFVLLVAVFVDVKQMVNGLECNQLAKVTFIKLLSYCCTIEIECPKLKPPKYGKLYVSGNYPGDHAIYNCLYGYKVVGKRRRVCLYNGKWSGSDVDCVKDDYYANDGYGYNKFDN